MLTNALPFSVKLSLMSTIAAIYVKFAIDTIISALWLNMQYNEEVHSMATTCRLSQDVNFCSNQALVIKAVPYIL